MYKLVILLRDEPVTVLSAITALTAVLAQQYIIPTWVPLTVLAVVTPIQRQLVTPESKLRKLGATVRKELRI